MLHRRWRDGKVKVVCATIGMPYGDEFSYARAYPSVSLRDGHRQGRCAVCHSSYGAQSCSTITCHLNNIVFVAFGASCRRTPAYIGLTIPAEVPRRVLPRIGARRPRRQRCRLCAILPPAGRVQDRDAHLGRARRPRERQLSYRLLSHMAPSYDHPQRSP